MNNFRDKQLGSVLLITSVAMGLVVFMILFSVDFARYFIFKARLQNIADNASDAGAQVVSEEIVRYAKPRMEALDDPIFTDPLEYVNDNEREEIISGSGREKIISAIAETEKKNFEISKLNGGKLIFVSTVPARTVASSCSAFENTDMIVKTELSYEIPIIFKPLSKLLSREILIVKAQSLAKAPLCPQVRNLSYEI